MEWYKHKQKGQKDSMIICLGMFVKDVNPMNTLNKSDKYERIGQYKIDSV